MPEWIQQVLTGSPTIILNFFILKAMKDRDVLKGFGLGLTGLPVATALSFLGEWLLHENGQGFHPANATLRGVIVWASTMGFVHFGKNKPKILASLFALSVFLALPVQAGPFIGVGVGQELDAEPRLEAENTETYAAFGYQLSDLGFGVKFTQDGEDREVQEAAGWVHFFLDDRTFTRFEVGRKNGGWTVAPTIGTYALQREHWGVVAETSLTYNFDISRLHDLAGAVGIVVKP